MKIKKAKNTKKRKADRLKEYFVCWNIEVDAKSPREAAEKALKIQRDPDSWATSFNVFGPTGRETPVSLGDE